MIINQPSKFLATKSRLRWRSSLWYGLFSVAKLRGGRSPSQTSARLHHTTTNRCNFTCTNCILLGLVPRFHFWLVSNSLKVF